MNPRLALSVTARVLGNAHLFNAAVINLEIGIQEAGDTVNYQSIADGMSAMEELTLKLTGQKEALPKIEKERQKAEVKRQEKEAKDEQERQKTAAAKAEEDRKKAAAAGMVFVPAGTFMMGSASGENDEKPVHQVTISTAFYMSKYEVTQKEWRDVMENNPSYFKGDNLPVENVSWYDTTERESWIDTGVYDERDERNVESRCERV
jgi:formylglycine-generating enzyme required for sulfatase activity